MHSVFLNELKILMNNQLVKKINIVKIGAGYSIVLQKEDKSSYLLVKDKDKEKARSYTSLDRLISAMQELGYSGNYEIFLSDGDSYEQC